MKLTGVLIFAIVLSANAASYSQATQLNVILNNGTLVDAFKLIEDQSDYGFYYNKADVTPVQGVSVNIKGKKIEEVLDRLLANTDLEYKMIDRYIVVKKRDDSSFPGAAGQTPRTVSGKVTDSSGASLPGVSIVIKGTTRGTITDADGNYSLTDVPADGILVFSFVGMKAQEIPVAGKTSVNVGLEEEAIGLEEVVAIGYGTQKKVNLTGAVSRVTAERLENRPITSVGQGLQGVIPNLNISIRNGDPTTSATFNVRGFESITGGSPLILVDGVPMALELINPNDIESVNVLKDASAAAVYGARAAFGVILVETKKGKGKVNVTLSSEQSLAKPIFLLDMVSDPYKYVLAMNGAYLRTTGAPLYDDYYVNGTKAWVENPTDENAWEVVNGKLNYYGNNDYKNKVITDFAPQQKYDMTISLASEKASYYASFGFLNKDGYSKSEKNEHFKRYNILMKADFKIKDWLSIDEKIIFNSQVSDEPHYYHQNTNINMTARVPPIFPIKFPDLPYYITQGDHDQYEKYIGMYFDTGFLPYLEEGGRDTYTINDTWFMQGITLTPVQGLKIRSDFSYNTYFRNSQDVHSKIDMVSTNLLKVPMIENGFSSPDWIKNQTAYNQYYVFNAYAEYTLEQFKDHYLKAMIGFNQEWGRNSTISAQANTLISPLITDIKSTTGLQQVGGGKSQVSLRGMFYRLNYIYKDKYLFEASGRYDGTSRFAKDSRFGFFPSASLGWRISKEPFMERAQGWVNDLKLRASYGELGNQLVSTYAYIANMGTGMSNIIMSSDRIPYISAAGLVSPNLTWERVVTTNFGVDFTIIDQRLDVSADIYTRDTKDMLMNVTYPAILGTNAPKENAADLRTKGWELSVTWRSKRRIGQDWQYALNLALSDNQTEITKYENPTGAINDYYVGKKIGEIWGFETVGIFQYDDDVANAPSQAKIGSNWKAGDMQYANLNDDEEISYGKSTLDDPGDQKIIGNTTPRYSFGINPDVSYKNWTLNIFFQGLFRDYLPETAGWQAFYPFNTSIVQEYDLTETWSEDNRDAYFAAPHVSTNTQKNILPQSRYVQNAAYIRLKNLTLNYNLPRSLVNKAGMSRAQVYLSGMNLWEYSKMHKPLDPESVYTTAQEYYKQRIYTLGVKITF